MDRLRKPDFIIIGAQKSASTFLQDCLNNHPEIYLLPNEIPFFESPDYENGEVEDLFSRFNSRKERIVGFKRPNYLGKKEVPGRLKQDLPDAKLIAVLRDPVERAISAIYHNINYGFLPLSSPEDLIVKLLNNEEILGYLRANEILEFGLYSKYLDMYNHYYSNNRLLLLTHDEIKTNVGAALKKVFNYLEVDPNYSPKNLNRRPQSAIYNLKRLKFARAKNKIIYSYNDERTRLKKKEGVTLKGIKFSFDILDKYLLKYIWKNTKEKISKDIKVKLYEYYRTDIHCIKNEYQLDVDNWIKKYENH